MLGALIGGGLNLIGGLIKGAQGKKQRKEGRKLLGEAGDPDYTIPGEITQAASEGLPSEQYNNAMKNIQRQQATAISSSQDRRGAGGLIGRIQRSTNDATLGLDSADATARRQNQRTLATYKDKAWDWNTRQRFERKYNYAQSLIGAGNQNISNGIDQGVSGVGMGALGLFGGEGGSGGGTRRGGRRASAGNATYYNGYNQDSEYGDFQSEYN
jgi:hypothetical protein